MSFSESSVSTQPSIDNQPNREICHYSDLLRQSIRDRFKSVTENRQGKVNLFTTATTNLFQIFLEALPADFRQHHTCNSCRQFVDRFGGIVTIDPDGKTIPVMWNPELVPDVYAPAVTKLSSVVASAAIDNVFLSDLRTWGTPVTGNWEHIAIVPSQDLVFESTNFYTIYQIVAQKQQDYQMLLRGLADFPLEVAKQASSLLSNATLYRSSACIGIAKWFLDLHQQRQSARNSRLRENLTWVAVANAPSGFCHIRSGMLGTLLEDIQNGLTFEQIAQKFNAKMNPLQYLRPQAPPKAGNIAQAEKIIEQLQTAGALDRRFAKLEDLQALWVPHSATPKVESKGIFGHLQTATTKAQRQIDMPPIVMTWEKFARTILPNAKSIEYFVPTSKQPYMALVTAQNPEAPPIIQWDTPEYRNPVTWYFYANGSSPNAWNLRSNAYCNVTAIVLQPSLWNQPEKFAHKGEKAFLILQNVKDKQYQKGAGFFPESLKNEYHSIRSTMEAYAKNAVLKGKDEATACGIGLQKGGSWDSILLRVTTRDNLQVKYQLDRWD
ncbi:hypothetical protein [Chamaesiphon sp. GL140_3_metabinner_50]|uniref:hypothetical protein n=1 Tax=Chamaesiphon sp. GL140_3_metabinner_50 TaxID=2970812 RepID=UPI0025F2C411|nr:hypothetical protein [Chamaesiphon sp. GL140_3_metabinner_50]